MRAKPNSKRLQWELRAGLVLALIMVVAACASESGETTSTSAAQGTTSTSEPEATTTTEAEGWPTDPVTFVVPAGPGSTIDRLMRGAEPYLSESLGVPVVVDNREGGAFTIGMEHVLNQPADGSTVFVFVDPFFTGARLTLEVPASEFAYLGGVAIDTPAIVGGPDRFQDLNGVLDALETGERVLFGVLPGDPAWAGFREILNIVGLENEPEYVSYTEGGALRVDLLGGHVDMIIGNHGGFLPLHQSGEGRFLVFFSEERYETAADVPTAGEIVEANGGNAADAPVLSITRMFSVRSEVAEEHPARVAVLSDAIEALTTNADFLAWAEGEGLPIEWVTPETVGQGTVSFEDLYQRYPEVLGQ